jgi:hypothetical protein
MKTSVFFSRIVKAGLTFVTLCLTGTAWIVSAADYEWTFSQGNLNAAFGDGVMQYADGAISQGLTGFGTTDGSTVPNINGQAATYMRVPAFSGLGNGYLLTLTSSGPNGGGAYINQYTFIFDVLSPGSLNWTPFFNTEPGNANDADFYLAGDGSIGIGILGYSGAGVIQADAWYRIAFAADLGAGTVSYFVNGSSVYDQTGGSLLDGRLSLYSNADTGADVLLFNEGDTSGQYTHELLVNSIYFTDRMLSAADIAALGGPNALGIAVPEPSSLLLLALGAGAFAAWRRKV